MDRLIYTALSGLKSRMAAQATIANNIANANTTGYRADRVSFEQAMLKGGGQFESRRPAAEEVTDIDRKAGAIISTGRDLDVAIATDSWIAVQAGDGTEGYTRRGDLHISDTGMLETGDGHPVLGETGPITVPPHERIAIADDGSISIVPLGAEPGAVPQEIGKIKLVSDAGSKTVKGLDGLMRVERGGVLPTDLKGRVMSRSLEQSNVNLTQALVDMIENQRAYEVQANLVKEAKEMDEKSASLMRIQ
ncbi:flagellar basal-body rod protein FlgF [Sphingomonas sp. FW199]|uniref:flagellar basal-body rod protein FlgF n=1 Tax=Sphingomonas sp. FW199 TaxID=3400217 RepID=UPI003CF0D6E4